MFLQFILYHSFQKERLWWYQSQRNLAHIGQRLWRGHFARSKCRRRREMLTLPDPAKSENFNYWIKLKEESNPPCRTWGIHAEYIIGGKPQTWNERNAIKRYGKYYRDVVFYVNTLTCCTSWDQPPGWISFDRRQYLQRQEILSYGYTTAEFNAAQKLQSIWRAKVARTYLRLILKSQVIMKHSEIAYQQNPSDVKNQCNYSLFVHVIQHDYDKARVLYNIAFESMEDRGIDNPFLLYSLGIFFAVTQEEEWSVIKDYIYRARLAEQKMVKRAEFNQDSRMRSSYTPVYNMACAGFFRHAALSQQSGESWHNYAICLMLVFRDFKNAR